jgi:DNA-binding NtrC family response regulator
MANILIIDDDEQYPKMMAKILKQEGHHNIVTATNGAEGLDLIKMQHFDLIITDILMPTKDGIDLIADLVNANSKVPVIAISGGRNLITPEFNLSSAKTLGVKIFLKKPFTNEQLVEAVKNGLNMEHSE